MDLSCLLFIVIVTYIHLVVLCLSWQISTQSNNFRERRLRRLPLFLGMLVVLVVVVVIWGGWGGWGVVGIVQDPGS